MCSGLDKNLPRTSTNFCTVCGTSAGAKVSTWAYAPLPRSPFPIDTTTQRSLRLSSFGKCAGIRRHMEPIDNPDFCECGHRGWDHMRLEDGSTPCNVFVFPPAEHSCTEYRPIAG